MADKIPGGPETCWLPSTMRTRLHEDAEERGIPRNQVLREIVAAHYNVDIKAEDLRRRGKS